MELERLELLVVGAGPAGISLAAEARVAGLAQDAVLVLEKAPAHSWAIRTLYPESKRVTATYKGIDARCQGVLCVADGSKAETLTVLDRAIAEHGIRVSYQEEVHAVEVLEPAGSGFVVRTGRGAYRAQVVVVAIGIFGRPNRPDYPLPRSLGGRVLFDVTSVAIAGEQVLVVGGGDSASEYCQFLAGAGNRVTLSYRRREFSRMVGLNRESLAALEAAGRVTVWRESNVVAVEDEGGRPRVRFAEREPATFDRVIYALGGTTPQGFLRAIGVTMEGDAPVLGPGGATAVPGLFLSGDLTAGKRGGSIIAAFNASRQTMREICDNHLECDVPDRDSG